MAVGAFELIVGAIIVSLALIWRLWPRGNRHDLMAPPKDLEAKPSQRIPVLPPERELPELHSNPPKIPHSANRGEVKDESDYSEDDLMMRDVRAALHRGKKIEAIKRLRQTRDMSLAEAKAFVEKIDLPSSIGEIRYKEKR